MNFKHSGNIGDCVYSIPTVLSLCERFQTKANLYLQCDVHADYATGINHPAGQFRMTRPLAEALVPLLKSQPIFTDVAIHTDQQITVDLDWMRQTSIDFRLLHIDRWYF
jgi:hypothetical protein